MLVSTAGRGSSDTPQRGPVVALVVAVAAVIVMPSTAAPAGTATVVRSLECTVGGPDFNGDRCADLAVADPDATVSGKVGAGRVNVLYGSESGTGTRAVLAQGQPGVAGTPESGDRFGAVIRAASINGDEFTDLVIATPNEDVGGAVDAGIIHVVFGSVDGLGAGQPSVTLRQGLHGVPGSPESGDRFGAGLAVNTTTGDSQEPEPAVGYGAPGEDLGHVTNAGTAGLVTFDRVTGAPAVAAAISQNSPGISGSAEPGDRFGAAVELFQGPGGFGCDTSGVRGYTLVVGASGEDLGGVPDAGIIHLARDLASDVTLSQDSAGVSGLAEGGDQFGASLALWSYCEHDGPSHVTLGVGVPAEDIGSVRDAGAAHLFGTFDDEIPMPERWSVSQDTDGVEGTAEAGDRFGTTIALRGPWREGIGEPVVISAPGEDVGTAADAGAVQAFGDGASTPGTGDVFVSQATVGQPVEAGDHFGAAVLTRHTHLFVAAPDDATYQSGVVHGIAWGTLFGTPTPHLLFAPGLDGVPTGGSRFGAGLA